MQIREAVETDANNIVYVLKESVRKVCGEMYKDETILHAWSQNKTPENIISWMVDSYNKMLVVENAGQIVGVGLARKESECGKILLCYLLKEALGQGYGKALLQALEDWLRNQKAKTIIAESTLNAGNFYLSRGYQVKKLLVDDPVSLYMEKSIG